MKIFSIYDAEFAAYGNVINGYDNSSIVEALKKTPVPEAVAYVASEPTLEILPVYKKLCSNFAGGMDMQMGYCNGHNTKLNALEYHRDSEVNLGATDFILLLAKREDIINDTISPEKVKAFFVPAGIMVEVYATTLHFAPCSAKKEQGFQVLIFLPRGTNCEKPEMVPINDEDKLLFACNKWLIAHAKSKHAGMGAHVGLLGELIDIQDFI